MPHSEVPSSWYTIRYDEETTIAPGNDTQPNSINKPRIIPGLKNIQRQGSTIVSESNCSIRPESSITQFNAALPKKPRAAKMRAASSIYSHAANSSYYNSKPEDHVPPVPELPSTVTRAQYMPNVSSVYSHDENSTIHQAAKRPPKRAPALSNLAPISEPSLSHHSRSSQRPSGSKKHVTPNAFRAELERRSIAHEHQGGSTSNVTRWPGVNEDAHHPSHHLPTKKGSSSHLQDNERESPRDVGSRITQFGYGTQKADYQSYGGAQTLRSVPAYRRRSGKSKRKSRRSRSESAAIGFMRYAAGASAGKNAHLHRVTDGHADEFQGCCSVM
jgi:hypothetical protein